MTNEALIKAAEAVLRPHTTKQGRVFGDVGAAVLTVRGTVYTGVAVDTPSWGLCAERAAIAAMITAGEYEAAKLVAVWRDKDSKLYVLPPCGVCREFLRSVDVTNLETDIVLGKQETKKLAELLPSHDWPKPL